MSNDEKTDEKTMVESALKIKKPQRAPNFVVSTCMMVLPLSDEEEEDPVVQCWIVERPRLPALVFWDIESFTTYLTTKSIRPSSSAPVGVCPYCCASSASVIKYGTRKRKSRTLQRYFCNKCARTFNIDITPAAKPIEPVGVAPVEKSPLSDLHVHNLLQEGCHA